MVGDKPDAPDKRRELVEILKHCPKNVSSCDPKCSLHSIRRMVGEDCAELIVEHIPSEMLDMYIGRHMHCVRPD